MIALSSAIRAMRFALTTIVAIALLLAAAELACRTYLNGAELTPPLFSPSNLPSGYRLESDVSSKVRQFGQPLAMSTDSASHRLTPGAAGTGIPVHLIGDSQVFGWGLSDQQTIAAHLQGMLGPQYQVINHGVPGYGPLDYAAVVNTIPQNDRVIVLQTEENDLWDAYGLNHGTNATCGYLSSGPGHEFIGCGLMHSRLVQLAFEALDSLTHEIKQTPFNMSENARVAAAVTGFRVRTLDDKPAQKRGACILFSIVPWKGRYDREWRSHYAPRPIESAQDQPPSFRDDVGMLTRFRSAPRDSYLDGDSHLSPRGALLVATQLMPFVKHMTCPLGESAHFDENGHPTSLHHSKSNTNLEGDPS